MNNTHKSRFLSGFRFKQFTVRQDRFTLGLRLDECSFSPGVQKRNNFPEHPLTNHAIWHLILN